MVNLGIYDIILDKPWHKEFVQRIDYWNNIYYISYKSKEFTLKGLSTVNPNIPRLNLIEVNKLEEKLVDTEKVYLTLLHKAKVVSKTKLPKDNSIQELL